MISPLGNLVVRYVAGLYRVRDRTAGLRAIRSSLLRDINFNELRVQEYAFQIALLHQVLTLGAKIREAPVDFIDRVEGDSKLGLSDIIEFLINAWWIRLSGTRTFIKFGIVGGGVWRDRDSWNIYIVDKRSSKYVSRVAYSVAILRRRLFELVATGRCI